MSCHDIIVGVVTSVLSALYTQFFMCGVYHSITSALELQFHMRPRFLAHTCMRSHGLPLPFFNPGSGRNACCHGRPNISEATATYSRLRFCTTRMVNGQAGGHNRYRPEALWCCIMAAQTFTMPALLVDLSLCAAPMWMPQACALTEYSQPSFAEDCSNTISGLMWFQLESHGPVGLGSLSEAGQTHVTACILLWLQAGGAGDGQ